MQKLRRFPIWKEREGETEAAALPAALAQKMEYLQPFIAQNDDLYAVDFRFASAPDGLGERTGQGKIIYLDGVVDDTMLDEYVLKPLRSFLWKESPADMSGEEYMDMICSRCIHVAKYKVVQTEDELLHEIFDGMTVVLFEGVQAGLSLDIHGGMVRSIDEPPTEKAISGPREGFVENFDINISLIRRRLRDPNLVVKKTRIGRRTHTGVALLYLQDVADPDLVEKIQRRLDAIDIDGIVSTDYIAQLLESAPWSFFPQYRMTERSDKAVAGLLEGRIALVIAGTPQVMFVPSLFLEFMQAPEDYYERSLVGSYVRLIRLAAFVIALSFPALYVALSSFHPELIPFRFLVPIAEARSQVPFPVLFEMLLQEFILQLVIEAGLRLPGSIGQTVGVVAGIVLGQAAISANIASPVVIIVIAITTISTFSLPSQALVQATRILRLPLLLFTGAFGLFGFSLGWLLILSHLTALQNFGVPYLAPWVPGYWRDWKDEFIRAFLWKMNRRPESIPGQQKWRQGRTRTEEEGGEE